MQSYCEKHSVSSKKLGKEEGESEECEDGSPKKKKDWTSEQKNQARAAKLRQIESEFFKHVDVLETSNFLDIDFETTETIFNYWKLKRRVFVLLSLYYYWRIRYQFQIYKLALNRYIIEDWLFAWIILPTRKY